MTGAPVVPVVGPGFSINDQVEVRAFGVWRPGRVVGLWRTRVQVEYSTRAGCRRRRATFIAGNVRRVRSATDLQKGTR